MPRLDLRYLRIPRRARLLSPNLSSRKQNRDQEMNVPDRTPPSQRPRPSFPGSSIPSSHLEYPNISIQDLCGSIQLLSRLAMEFCVHHHHHTLPRLVLREIPRYLITAPKVHIRTATRTSNDHKDTTERTTSLSPWHINHLWNTSQTPSFP